MAGGDKNSLAGYNTGVLPDARRGSTWLGCPLASSPTEVGQVLGFIGSLLNRAGAFRLFRECASEGSPAVSCGFCLRLRRSRQLEVAARSLPDGKA
jgi:hypothetical protein